LVLYFTSILFPVSSLPTNWSPAFSNAGTISGFTYGHGFRTKKINRVKRGQILC
jgi:hypothetical protein